MTLNKKQLEKGIKIELEHTKNRMIACKIAREHLRENPKYYKEASVSGINKLVRVKKKPKRQILKGRGVIFHIG